MVSRDKRGDSCAQRAFHVAGAGNCARQLKPLDFLALCEKSGERVRVDV